MADEFEQASRGKRTVAQIRKVLSELHANITGQSLPQTTVRSFFENWLGAKKLETAPATQVFYRGATNKFVDFLGDEADKEITLITRDHLHRFRSKEAKTLAPKTVNHEIKCLRMVFRSAKRDGFISEDPAEFVDTIRDKQAIASRRVFTLPELSAVLSVADDEWRTMIYFGLYTGQRLGDIAGLTWANVDLHKREIRLVTRKTGKRLILPIAPPLQHFLEGLSSSDAHDEPLHPRAFAILQKQNGKTGHLSNHFADLLAAAGLREKKAHRSTGVGRGGNRDKGGLSFHSLRHTAVSLLKEAGIPAAVVMELIGHDSEQMSEHYTHVGSEALRKAAEALPVLNSMQEA